MHFKINSKKYEYTSEYIFLNSNEFNVPLIEFCNIKGYKIPHYCYHNKLSIAGNCRMCLIELKNSPKPIVSCAMTAKTCLSNSELFTNSPLVKKARENIMEFLLLNHPLDCPICDQGGECDLQDQALFFGFSKKRFYNYKRIVIDKNIGPIIKTVMTRCIHCTRCVRFASEIAGIGDLGTFNRGLHSEIGTYVNKIFQSELAGNAVDLCPVGALTSKPYPFLARNWELKQVNSIDFSDGFGLDTQIFLKNNTIIKILPGYNSVYKTNCWISDKTRFSFDGMFCSERKILKSLNEKKHNKFFWNKLFNDLINIIYCQDHLNKHHLDIKYLVVVFSSNINLEVLNLLFLISKTYNFLKLKNFELLNINNDLETNFISRPFTKSNLISSDVCFLLNTNTRFEASHLNLKLRQRFLHGNFKFFSFGSTVNLTYPINYIGSNLKTLKSFVEGNNLICQDFKTATNPFLVCSLENFKRIDSNILVEFFKILKLHSNLATKTWDGINILSNNLNDAGLNILNNFPTVNTHDFKNSFGIYFLNTNTLSGNIKKIIELKLLNFIIFEKNLNKIFLEQNFTNQNFIQKINKMYPIYNYKSLPNNVFFETSGTYLNTEGFFKKTIKIVPALQKSKEDWYILRKLLSHTKSVQFLSFPKINKKIHYNCNNLHTFKNYINFNYFASKSLDNMAFYLNTKINHFSTINQKYKISSKKFFNTKLKFWLDDFYIGGKDNYSIFSSTMIECSLNFRFETTNFN